jgi:hypothetical protein
MRKSEIQNNFFNAQNLSDRNFMTWLKCPSFQEVKHLPWGMLPFGGPSSEDYTGRVLNKLRIRVLECPKQRLREKNERF